MLTLPLTRDLVLIGGGHAHALVLLDWAASPLPGARLTLITPEPTAAYTGMLPGHIAGHYPRAALEMDLVQLARHAGARLILGRAEGLDLAAGTVAVGGRPDVGFDLASINIGITSDLPGLKGYADHATAAKPLGDYAARWERFMTAVEAGQALPEVVVLGAGLGGVELAMAMDHRLRKHPDRRITLAEQGAEALPHLSRAARQRLLAELASRGIALLTQARAVTLEARAVTLADGRRLPAGLILSAAGARPQGWLQDTGLALTTGFITVDPFLRAQGQPNIFAAGDCAHLAHAPRPKAGVFALRQAPVLGHNLRATLSGGKLKRYQPQRDYLKLVSLGRKTALAEKWGMSLKGRWLWSLKNRIDRRFMHMFHNLPEMPAPRPPMPATPGMAQALARLPMMGRITGLEAGAGDNAAVLRQGGQLQVIATDHLRAFTDDPHLLARIAATHALGDIWAMGARPQLALVSLTLPLLFRPLHDRTLREIMAGADAALAGAGAGIAGGSVVVGSEMSIGFTVTGTAQGRVLTKAGAQAGDRLILTKPLGSGMLLAAEMGRKAQGRDIAALWPFLLQPQNAASAILAPAAHAMTKIGGFGLAGHLDEMLRAGGLSARIALADLPLLPGAGALAAGGASSGWQAANRAALAGRIDAADTARTRLLFDPQTAGGLLAAVPAAHSAACLAQLSAAGYSAAIIGTLLPALSQSTITAD